MKLSKGQEEGLSEDTNKFKIEAQVECLTRNCKYTTLKKLTKLRLSSRMRPYNWSHIESIILWRHGGLYGASNAITIVISCC